MLRSSEACLNTGVLTGVVKLQLEAVHRGRYENKSVAKPREHL